MSYGTGSSPSPLMRRNEVTDSTTMQIAGVIEGNGLHPTSNAFPFASADRRI
jgi:hypothetical protein